MTLTDAVGQEWLDRHVLEALEEDLGDRGDITSLSTIPSEQQGYAELIAKSHGVIAGIDWAIHTGKMTKPSVKWEFVVEDGTEVEPGQLLAKVTGPVHGILISERTALNGLGRLSGVATFAHQCMEAVKGTNAVVIDTRKTTPGWRLAEKYAVTCGGAGNHRIGLYDEVLIKENHIEAAGGVAEAVRAARSWVVRHGGNIPVEVEVETLDQLNEALAEQPDRILLDNFTLDSLKVAVERNKSRCILEASGGITLADLSKVAATGVNRISLGVLTHSAKPLDISLLMK
ncbi:nicotinate-nucleotide pyrophosphorylase [carboxylating] [bacterium BMS3Bbin04]|nr:nicotinate-nucleotide pyrophosphorylase [carboxylating] [bacterium BMS3Bbin04]